MRYRTISTLAAAVTQAGIGLAPARAQTVVLDPATVDVGTALVGGVSTATFTVANSGASTVTRA